MQTYAHNPWTGKDAHWTPEDAVWKPKNAMSFWFPLVTTKKIPSLEETAFFWKGTICAVSTVQVYICWYSYYNYTKTNTVYIHYIHIYVCNIYIHIYMYSMIIYACVLLLLNGIFVKRGRNQSFIIH